MSYCNFHKYINNLEYNKDLKIRKKYVSNKQTIMNSVKKLINLESDKMKFFRFFYDKYNGNLIEDYYFINYFRKDLKYTYSISIKDLFIDKIINLGNIKYIFELYREIEKITDERYYNYLKYNFYESLRLNENSKNIFKNKFIRKCHKELFFLFKSLNTSILKYISNNGLGRKLNLKDIKNQKKYINKIILNRKQKLKYRKPGYYDKIFIYNNKNFIKKEIIYLVDKNLLKRFKYYNL